MYELTDLRFLGSRGQYLGFGVYSMVRAEAVFMTSQPNFPHALPAATSSQVIGLRLGFEVC